MARRRRMTAKQKKYFGKRRTRTVYRTKVKRVMARGRRYRGYARKAYSKLGGRGMITPIIGGVADNVLDRYLPLPIDGIGATAVGIFMHSPVVKDIGLYKVGFSIGNLLPLPGSASSGGWL